VIAPKSPKPTAADERRAYRMATERDTGRCQRCLRNCGMGVTSRHHRKARGVGGWTHVANLLVVGGTGTTGCHGEITSHPAQAIDDGWMVPGWADPLTYPCRRWLPTGFGTVRLAWVLMRNDGKWDEITDDDAQRRIRDGVLYEEEAS